jgi:glucose-6-phosphate isomerase
MEEINLSQLTPDVRKLSDMSDVIFDKEWLKTADNPNLYYMYRGIKTENGLRYDITVIPALMLGKEYIKTKGHFHSTGHPEFYTVLEGQAFFLMQKGNKDCYFVKVNKGESVIIPGEYEHVTINQSDTETLKMANWISQDYKSDYSTINDKQGACWFYTIDGWIKNSNYGEVPELRTENPLEKDPENFEFLKKTK